MPRNKGLLHVKTVRSKGRTYLYFLTGDVTATGKPMMHRLPDPSEPNFGAVYGSLLAGRSRRENARAILTVPQLVNLYQKSPHFRRLSNGTQRVYLIYTEEIAANLNTAPAGAVERRDVLALMARKGDRTGAANGILRTMRAMYAWARKFELLECDPCKGIDLFDSTDYEPWPEDLLNAALDPKAPADVRLPVALAYFTAQRVGDLCKMRWSDISEEKVSVQQEKTDKKLDIDLLSELRAILDETPKRGMTILADHAGKKLSTGTLRNRLQNFAKPYGIHIVPHGLRKNAVNSLLEAGCTAAETSAVSGQSMSMIEHYAKRRSTSKLATAAILKFEASRS